MADRVGRAAGRGIRAGAAGFDAWFLADQPAVARAASAAEIAGMLRAEGCGPVSESRNVRQAFRRAQGLLREGDRLVVFGSFHTVAAVMGQLAKDRNRK